MRALEWTRKWTKKYRQERAEEKVARASPLEGFFSKGKVISCRIGGTTDPGRVHDPLALWSRVAESRCFRLVGLRHTHEILIPMGTSTSLLSFVVGCRTQSGKNILDQVCTNSSFTSGFF